jgi:hypothetical protein
MLLYEITIVIKSVVDIPASKVTDEMYILNVSL